MPGCGCRPSSLMFQTLLETSSLPVTPASPSPTWPCLLISLPLPSELLILPQVIPFTGLHGRRGSPAEYQPPWSGVHCTGSAACTLQEGDRTQFVLSPLWVTCSLAVLVTEDGPTVCCWVLKRNSYCSSLSRKGTKSNPGDRPRNSELPGRIWNKEEPSG